MSYTMIDRDNLATSRSDPPAVQFLCGPDEDPVVSLRFTSSALRGGHTFQDAMLTFSSVLHFQWSDFDKAWPMNHGDDVEFGLVRITNSTLVDDWRRRDSSPRVPGGYGGGIDWGEVRHYRICFDDHGTYDIVCLDLQVSFCSSTN